MGRYIQIQFNNISEEQSGILIAYLSEAGFEGFEEKQYELSAFISEEAFDETVVAGIGRQMGVSFASSVIEETNWNQVWESNFSPVVVEDFAGIRAHFHQPLDNVTHEIVITPKMSFGTGHHATTYLVIREMKDIDFMGKKVFDFGTGTGVLAILAEKSGAHHILAMDNDRWSIENATENAQRNDCAKIDFLLADTPPASGKFDIIFANINRHVILANVKTLSQQIMPGGCIVLSGLLQEDGQIVVTAFEEVGLHLTGKAVRDNWLLLRLTP